MTNWGVWRGKHSRFAIIKIKLFILVLWKTATGGFPVFRHTRDAYASPKRSRNDVMRHHVWQKGGRKGGKRKGGRCFLPRRHAKGLDMLRYLFIVLCSIRTERTDGRTERTERTDGRSARTERTDEASLSLSFSASKRVCSLRLSCPNFGLKSWAKRTYPFQRREREREAPQLLFKERIRCDERCAATLKQLF